MIIIAIFWILVGLAAVLPLRWTVYFFFVALSYGSVTVIPGSTTIVPAVGVAPLLILKIASAKPNPSAYINMMLSPRGFAWLTAFLGIALLVTVTAPTLFGGAQVMGLNSLQREGLSFGSGQMTQSLYLLASYAMAVSIAILLTDEQGWRFLAGGMIAGACMAVISGAVDFATAGSGLLAPLRTAGYAIMADAEVNGVRRLIGFNTEASAFGGLTMALAAMLIFVQPSRFLGRRARIAEPVLTAILLVMAILSTSSASYLALGALLALYGLRMVAMIVIPPTNAERRMGIVSLGLLLMAIIVGAIVVLMFPGIITPVYNMFDSILFSKTQSSSYLERTSWNVVSLSGLADTGGYGVGVGATRASSWPVAIVSCTGILGAIAMLGFLAKCYLSPVTTDNNDIRFATVGARYALCVSLIPAISIGTVVDFGSINAILFAIIAAGAMIATPAGDRRQRVYAFKRTRAGQLRS